MPQGMLDDEHVETWDLSLGAIIALYASITGTAVLQVGVCPVSFLVLISPRSLIPPTSPCTAA